MVAENPSEVNENTNSLNSNNKQKKQESLTWEFLHIYAKDFDEKPNAKSLLNIIFSSDEATLDPEVKKDLEKSKARFSEKFSDLRIWEWINNFLLKTTLGKYYISLVNNEKSLKSILLSEYSLESKNEQEKLDKEVKSLSSKEVLELISSDKKRQEFAKKKLWNPSLLEILNFFPWEKELQKRFEKLDPQKKEDAISVLSKAKNIWTLDSVDISVLFKTGLLNKSEKAQFVYKFMPYITLEEAKNLGLLNNKEILAEKEKLVEERVASKLSISDRNLLKTQIKELAWNLRDEDILVETKSLKKLLDWENLDKIADPESRWFIELDKAVEDSLKNDEIWANSSIELRRRLDNILTVPRNFSKWNIIKIPWKDWKEDWYIRIDSFDDVKKIFSYTVVWAWNKISLDRQASFETKSYWDIEKLLKEFFEKSWNKIPVFTPSEIKEDKNLISYNLELISEQDYKNSSKKVNEDLFSTLNVRKEQLEQQITEITTKLTKVPSWIEKDKLEFQKKELEERLKELNTNIQSLNGNGLSSKQTVSLYNFQQLLSQLDTIDWAWTSLALNKWIFIEIEESWNKVSFEILWADLEKWEVSMRWADWIIENISFAAFFEAFRDKKAKRVEKIRDFSDLIEKSAWKWFEFSSSGWFIKKWTDWKKDEEITMLFSDKENKWDWTSILKLEKIDWDYVTVRYWEIDVKNSTEKKWKKEIKKIEKNYSMSKTTYTIKLNNLHNFIEQYNFTPLLEEKKEEKIWKDKLKNKDIKGDFLLRLLNNYSISELISWWNMALQAVQERLKRWTDIHSTKIAAGIWKWIPWNVWYDLQMKAEDVEKSETEKEIANLWKIDSKDSIPLIKSRIKNRNTPEYKKEAALLFMVEKYGSLTWKAEMFEYKWKFLWYEAFWWRIWDELYKKHEEYCIDNNQTFSEEDLMLKLLKQQCKSWWLNWIKRRSRLHKEFEAKKNKGSREGFQKWYDDAKNKNILKEMIDWWLWEAEWWTITEAIWWAKRAAEKGWSLEEMNEVIFSLLFSWALYHTDSLMLNEIKSLWDWQKIPMVTAIFSKDKAKMDLFNDIVVEVAKDLNSTYPWIYQDALNIRRLAKENSMSVEKRIKETRKFYSKYWASIMRAMNMWLSWDNSKDPRLDKAEKLILLKKDSSKNYNTYYNLLSTEDSFWTMWTFWEASMTDAWWDAWLWLNIREQTRLYLRYNQWGWFSNTLWWNKLWKCIVDDFDSIWNKIINLWAKKVDDPLNRLAQKKYVKDRLTQLIAWLLDNHWGRVDVLNSYNNSTSPTWEALNRWGLYLREFSEVSIDKLISWSEDNKLEPIINNILYWWKTVSIDQNPFKDPLSKVPLRVKQIL